MSFEDDWGWVVTHTRTVDAGTVISFVERLLVMGAVFAAGLHVGVKSGYTLMYHDYWEFLPPPVGLEGQMQAFAGQTLAYAVGALFIVVLIEAALTLRK